MSTGRQHGIDWKAVGKRIRVLRGSGKTQKEFARELGVSQGQLSRYEQGASEIGPEVSTFATAKHFCSWLGLCPQLKKTGGR